MPFFGFLLLTAGAVFVYSAYTGASVKEVISAVTAGKTIARKPLR